MANRQRSARLQQLWARLIQEHSEPVRLGIAVGLGIIVGCSPFYGLHLWIGLGLALLLRLNKLAVFLGSQISIPPLAPLLGFASVQVGSLLLHGNWLLLSRHDFQLGRLPSLLQSFFSCWLVGGLVVGICLALPAAVITASVVRARRRRAGDSTWRHQVSVMRRAFNAAPRGHRCYVASKLRMDPVYRQICEGLGQVEHVLDLGTGLGLLPLLLAVRGQANEIVGVEWDAGKLQSARLAADSLPTEAGVRVHLSQADLRDCPLLTADAILLVDVLHYFPPDEQQRVITRAAAALSPAGQLIVRETDSQARSLLTQLFEWVAVRLGWNKGPGIHHRSTLELRADLEAAGLRCQEQQASSLLHRGNVLLWARRV